MKVLFGFGYASSLINCFVIALHTLNNDNNTYVRIFLFLFCLQFYICLLIMQKL